MSGGPNLTEASTRALQAAIALAQENSNAVVTPLHLASALLTPGSLFNSIISKAGGNPELVERGLAKAIVRLPVQDPAPPEAALSQKLSAVIQKCQQIMSSKNDTFISQDHFIVALSDEPEIKAILVAAGTTPESIKKAADQTRGGKQVNSKAAEEGFEALSKYARDLTAEAESGKLDPVIGRDTEIRRTIRILSRRTKNNVVLIGEPGVGKTAIAEGLAQRIVARDVPVNLLGRLFSLDMGALMAGASYKGQFEERVKSVIDEIEASDTGIILFIDEMHTLMAGQGGTGVGAADLLKPALARGKLRCIGATTLMEYKKYIEKDAAFERRFQSVIVAEPTVAETISILRGLKEKYELHHAVVIMDSAIVAAASLAHRYLTARKLPDAAIDLLDEASAAIRVARDSQPEEVDRLSRMKLQLEIELTALRREADRKIKKDDASKEKIKQVEEQLAKIDEEIAPILARYAVEKGKAEEIQSVKQKLDEMKSKSERATRAYDLATAADIQHYAIPDLLARLGDLQEQKNLDDARSLEAGGPLAGDTVTPDAIQGIVAAWSGIPLTSLKTNEKQKLLRLEKVLNKAVIGQTEAVKAVADAIRLNKSGLANPDRPIASFLFVGPSGTGKTLLSKELAQLLFDSPDAMMRIDASEYSEKHSISRLIGSPPGYIGHDDGGQLTEYVRRKPYSIILIDEIEKACKEFTTLFLQVLDDGRLTDGQGRVINLRNCVIIMTSNLGSTFLNDLPEGSAIPPATKELVQSSIRSHFLPEFINRIDSIVIFQKLSRKEVRSIVNIRIAEIQKRLKNNGKNITLDISPEALDYLGAVGYHPSYGARPLNRVLQTELLNPLSRCIIEESIMDGEVAHVTLDARANLLLIQHNHEGVSMDLDDDDEEMVDDDIDIEEVDE